MFDFDSFMSDADRYGMPVRFLRYVRPRIAVATNGIVPGQRFAVPSTGETHYNDVLNLMDVDTRDADGLAAFHTASAAPSAVGDIYHEATHAYLDLRLEAHDRGISNILRDAESYYTGAPLQRGGQATNPALLAGEAAASFVGWCASAWWHAFWLLRMVQEGLVRRDPSGRTVRRPLRQPAQILARAETVYETSLRATSFGYDCTRQVLGRCSIWSEQIETTRPIMPRLREFLSGHLLENKIPMSFDAVPAFRELWRHVAPVGNR